MGWLELIFRGVSEVARLLGRSFRSWSEWAENNPAAAARQLELIADVLLSRALAYRVQNGWRARRDRELSRRLFAHAAELRSHAKGSKELAAACSKKPGTFGA